MTTLGPFTSSAIWSTAEKPLNPISSLASWLGRALIFVFACMVTIVSLGAAWRWPFIMVGRWYWYDFLVCQVRRELRIARKTATSEWDAVQLAQAALARRGLMDHPSCDAYARHEQPPLQLSAGTKREMINYVVNGGTKSVEQQDAEFRTSAAFYAADPATRPAIGGKTSLKPNMTDDELMQFVNDYRDWAIKNGHYPPDSVEHFRTIQAQRDSMLKPEGK